MPPEQSPRAREPAASEIAQRNELWKRMLDAMLSGPPRDPVPETQGLLLPRSQRGPECTRGASAASSTTWPGGWRPPEGPRRVLLGELAAED